MTKQNAAPVVSAPQGSEDVAMKIINLPRAGGKTTEAAKMSAEYNAPVLCRDKIGCQAVIDRAAEFGLTIPQPISIDDLHTLPESTVLIIDEALLVLDKLIEDRVGHGVSIHAITFSDDKNQRLCRVYGSEGGTFDVPLEDVGAVLHGLFEKRAGRA